MEVKLKTWQKSVTLPNAFRNAWRGIVDAFRGEWKLKIIMTAFAAALALALTLRLSGLAVAFIVFLSASIVAAEMFNTSLEALEDIMFPEYREAIRRSKDLAAGAVLVLSLASLVAAGLLFLPPIANLLV